MKGGKTCRTKLSRHRRPESRGGLSSVPQGPLAILSSRVYILITSDSCSCPGQARAKLSVKAGGFSIGAFAASNRGKLEEFYEVEKEVAGQSIQVFLRHLTC